MGRKLTALLLILLLPSLFVFAFQETPTFQLDITGVNPTDLPTVEVSANIEDAFGRSVVGLTPADITITGDLADVAEVIRVENVTDDNLPFAVVLTIDTSESMSGLPLQEAKDAARLFVEQLRPDDSVAIVDFDSRARVALPYTTDKEAALQTIDSLTADGRTALYDAGLLSVQTAADTDLSRRVAILLSDGAEFEEGRSAAARGVALETALTEGVPVYTIGLGFGTDRTYLQSLAEATNAQFYESPTPNELEAIYTELAVLLRSQTIITLNVDVPADGTVYDFGVEASTLDGAPSDTAQLFTPVPIPVVNLAGLPEGEITTPTTVTATVLADDPLTSVTAQFDDAEAVDLTLDDAGTAPITIDPLTFAPGDYTLTVTATDADDESGSATANFTIAALSPTVNIETVVEDEVLIVQVDTAGSQSSIAEVSATVAGISQLLQPATDDEGALIPNVFEGAFTLLDLPAGEGTVSVGAMDTLGNTTSEQITVTVPSVPPVVNVSLEPDTVLEEPTVVEVDVVAQTTDVTLAYRFDGGTAVALDPEDAIPVDVVGLGAGPHTLTITATDGNGEVTTVDVPFVVSEAAIPTPTPTPTFTPTFTPTTTPTNTPTATPTLDLPATANAVASATADAQATLDAVATVDAVATSDAVATVDAASTESAIAAANAQSTADVESTLAVRQTESVVSTATGEAQATMDAQASIEAQATRETRATANAQATADALVSPTPSPTVDATGTQEAADALATTNAEGTTVAIGVTATLEAEATALELASITEATDDAQATLDAQATDDAQATADVFSTMDANATADAQATNDAQATLDSFATADAEQTAQALGTRRANATATADLQTTIQAEANNIAASETADAVGTLENGPTATATGGPRDVPSATPVGTPEEVAPEPGGAVGGGIPPWVYAVCGIGLVLAIVVFVLTVGRRRRAEEGGGGTTG